MEDDYYKISNFDILLNEVSAANNHGPIDGVKIPPGCVCRYQFFELIIRMAKFLYSTGYMYRRGGRHMLTK